MPEEQKIYDEVSDEEYNQLVTKNKNKQSWIEFDEADEEDLEYRDDGEIAHEDHPDEELEASLKKKKRKRELKEQSEVPSKKIESFFKTPQQASVSTDTTFRPTKKARVNDLGSDRFASMVNDLISNPTGKEIAPFVGLVTEVEVREKEKEKEKLKGKGKVKEKEKEKEKKSFTKEELNVVPAETWKSLTSNLKAVTEEPEPALPSSTKPELPSQSPELKFYLIDIQQHIDFPFQTQKEKSGTIFLFGKVWSEKQKKFVSCTVHVHNVMRTLYVAPRERAIRDTSIVSTEEEIDIEKHVIPELLELRKNLGIPKMNFKPVRRKYAFDEPGVVQGESDFLKVVYSYEYPEVPDKSLRGNSFAFIFGTKTSPTENFIVQRKIMGPCWLRITNFQAQSTKLCWSATECHVEEPWCVLVDSQGMEPPPLSVLSLKIQASVNQVEKKSEIVAISGAIHNNVSLNRPTKNQDDIKTFTVLRKLKNMALPTDFDEMIKKSEFPIRLEGNERALLGWFLCKVHLLDPDIIVGHNILGYDMDVLLFRLKENNVPHWSRIGRLYIPKMPNMHFTGGTSAVQRSLIAGRLGCDTYLLSKEFVKLKSYSLSNLTSHLLDVKKDEFDVEMVPQMFLTSDSILELCKSTVVDSILNMKIMFKLNLIPLTKQLTELCGNRWVRSLTGARAERIEYLLMHEFYRSKPKYVLPDRIAWKGETKKEKPKYGGGLVLDPKVGYYDSFVLLLDFNSLYPSIIQEYNICFTTIPRSKDSKGDWVEVVPPPSHVEKGVLPKVIKKLISNRKAIKEQIKTSSDQDRKEQLDIQQLAIKLVANSMYGCLGFTSSRFFAIPLAQLITTKGREALKSTANLTTNQLKLEVIYGDTDSIMVDSKTKDLVEAKKIALQIKKMVNKLYHEMEIELDGVFLGILLLKKKKYACRIVREIPGKPFKTETQIKGLEMVRRDWCPLAATMGTHVVNLILDGGEKGIEKVVAELHQYLRTQASEVREGQIDNSCFIITKAISKNPEDYSDKGLPHVNVALANKKRGLPVHSGDFIEYVITTGEESVALRAKNPDQLGGEVKIDFEWYLANQIHPTISRLCAPIEGTDSALIAECLGLDPTKFKIKEKVSNDFRLPTSVRLSDKEKYKDVARLTLKCPQCKTEQGEFLGVYQEPNENEPKNDGEHFFRGLTCKNADCGYKFTLQFLKNKIQLLITQAIKKHHVKSYYCQRCSLQTQQYWVKNGKFKCTKQSCEGTLVEKYDHIALLLQLSYYRSLFDIDRALNRSTVENQLALKKIYTTHAESCLVFKEITQFMDGILKENNYNIISLKKLFSFYQ
eukprot:TRINITY_DN4165_c0_g1_i4.p1 TRINITY_DN4165_c0_g1~~TRINITY_DN4165_c0_g1_i4.p1  ORF type:complete len:1349 (+),score=392.60 TRINITY_DN4165_c0_g1_i4:85-4047(+)